eukprot:TRINITY_DN10920_c0_g3_i2.p1 TRINITY_DN10920_c0_g3~~TRINITY_DN10920_c0_g3_i2.p1  ORF type:complete len:356 (+),score=85.08 TRINITY_DN10920_c0_g3_i2:117-1184(+)
MVSPLVRCPSFAKLTRFHAKNSIVFDPLCFETPSRTSVGNNFFCGNNSRLQCSTLTRGKLYNEPIIIGDGLVLGNDSMIEAGVHLEHGLTLGAMSKLCKADSFSCTPHCTFVGSPGFVMRRGFHFQEWHVTCFMEIVDVITSIVFSYYLVLPMLITAYCLFWLLSAIGSDGALYVLARLGLWFVFVILLFFVYGLLSVCFMRMLGQDFEGTISVGSWKFTTKTLLMHIHGFFSSLLSLLPESVMIPIYLRCVGARLTANVSLRSAAFPEPSLLTIGEQTQIGEGATVQCHVFENGGFNLSRIEIGSEVHVGVGVVVLPGVQIGDKSEIDDSSLVFQGERLPTNSKWRGIPCERVG